MKQTSIKSDRVAELLEDILERTGESKVKAVTVALERRLEELKTHNRAERTLNWLETHVWPQLTPEIRGRAPTKQEQEELLGF